MHMANEREGTVCPSFLLSVMSFVVVSSYDMKEEWCVLIFQSASACLAADLVNYSFFQPTIILQVAPPMCPCQTA